MSTKYLGATAALSAGTDIRPPCKRNPSATTTWGNKFNRKEATVTAAAALQEASGTPAIRSAEMNQAESTVDQLSDRPLDWIPAHCHHTIIVLVLARNTYTPIKMGLLPVTLLRNLLIIKQSRKTRAFGGILGARHHEEPIVHSLAVIMPNHSSTAANSQQDIMIKSAETS